MQLLVQNEDKLVYEVELKMEQPSEFYGTLGLKLVCGWDYVSEDSDIQGYIAPNNFIEDVQYELITFLPLYENIIERLEEEGYKKIEAKDLAIENLLASL